MASVSPQMISAFGGPAQALRASRDNAVVFHDRRRRDDGLITPGPGAGGVAWTQQPVAAGDAACETGRIEAALASVDAGRLIALADIREWFESLGTDYVLPLPRARRWGDRARPAGATSLTDEAAQSLGQIEWWYAQPGVGAAQVAIRRIRAILAAIDRLSSRAASGMPGPAPGTLEVGCQQHRLIYQFVAHDDASRGPGEANRQSVGDAVVLDIFGPAHQ